MSEKLRALAGELGISDKDLKKLEKDYGSKLESTLRRWRRETRDTPRFMAKQQGALIPADARKRRSQSLPSTSAMTRSERMRGQWQ